MKNLAFVILMMSAFAVVSIAKTDNSSKQFGKWSTPVNLGTPVNSTFDDLAAVLSRDGLSLYFSSNRTGSVGEDIWVSRRANINTAWNAPVNLGAVVNSGSMDRLRSISADGRILLFQSDRPTGSIGGNDIWASTRSDVNDDFSWSAPVNLGAIINTPTNEVAANYLFRNQGGNPTLFFSSSRTGAGDIYTSELLPNGSFSQPVFVSELNSPYLEACFWVRDDGLEMIFSSTRYGSSNDSNSLDLWFSIRANVADNWSIPVRLGTTINTRGFREVNPSLSADWQTMYFTSNRTNGGLGGNDIYLTTRPRLR